MNRISASSGLTSSHAAGRNATHRYLIPDLPSTAELEPYLRRIDETQWYTNFGPLVCEFESRLKATLATRHPDLDAGHFFLTTLSSGFDALEVGLRMLHLQRSRRVLVPAVTFCACPLAVQHAGLEVVFADIDAESWILTPRIARAAAARMELAAVMPVAAYGVPLPAAEWDTFFSDTGIPVLIDAAAAFEVQPLLKHGLVAHSLHATKPLGIGEGGILVGCDAHLIERARRYTNFGMIERVGSADGANTRMSEYHAAVGLVQLNRWSEIKGRRRHLLDLFRQHLEPLSERVSLQPSIVEAVVSCLMVLIKDRPQNQLLAEKDFNGIAFHRTYLPPLYRHPIFERLPVVNTNGDALPSEAEVAKKLAHMRNSEMLMRCLLGVPFHPFMDEYDVVSVVDALSSLLH